MDRRMYVIQVIDNETKRQVHRSFAHVWAECEELYVEYQEEFEGCSVNILPATKEDRDCQEVERLINQLSAEAREQGTEAASKAYLENLHKILG